MASLTGSSAIADESDFLQTLSGNWQGTGQVRLKPDAQPMHVSCTLDSRADGEEISMQGACRANVVFSRRIGADLQAQGARYTGSYVGSIRGPATLSGSRNGGTLDLRIRWPARNDTGRTARMQVASLGSGRMRLVTSESHPRSGERIVTARIEFSRK
ncbi:hypothetical protein [Mesorhizobium sp. L-8-10]|uniref:hypothetical protein n=1 Tax=Mesorhizobium sp. L-8-10 TaxID=2744523 RepID=UPI001927FA98|nr:hypothetical protein [Mesorhizobium sp. L-8-10]